MSFKISKNKKSTKSKVHNCNNCPIVSGYTASKIDFLSATSIVPVNILQMFKSETVNTCVQQCLC